MPAGPLTEAGFHVPIQRMDAYTIRYERTPDGRWLAEVLELPGVLAYGDDADKAVVKVMILATLAIIDLNDLSG